MTAVVPKFQYFQLFVDHKDMTFDNAIDDIHVSSTPDLPTVLCPKSPQFNTGIRGSPRFKVKAQKGNLNQCHGGSSNVGSSSVPPMAQIVGHELRRSRRKLVVEEEICNEKESDSDDSEWDSDWVDSDNEVGKDDDDLYEEWVDDKFEQKKKKKSKLEQDSDYESDELQELQDSELEESDSAEEVEVVDAQGRKTRKKKVKLKRWRPENMKEAEPEPIHIILPEEAEPLPALPAPSQRKKMPVKRPTYKKKSCPQLSSRASSLVSPSMTYDLASSTVMEILQDQVIATQQSQTSLPAPLPDSQFLAACRDALPPPRVQTTVTLGLKRRKKVTKTKENKAP
ncbi:hypothetical protein D1007_23187 [Hordeum vulgare]|nr:hypothetical protein D1007_23187 [Hordeum vulgare]